MHKKLAIFGLVLLLSGVAAFDWIHSERKNDELMLQKKRDLLRPQLMELYPLKIDQKNARYLADTFFDDSSEQELARSQKQNETKGLIFFSSVSFMAVGGTIFGGYLIVAMAKLLAAGCSGIKKLLLSIYRNRKHDTNEQELEISAGKKEETLRSGQEPHKGQNSPKKHSAIPENSGLYNFRKKDADTIGKLYRSKKTSEPRDTSKVGIKDPDAETKPFDHLANDIRKTILSDYHETTLKLEDSFKNQAENLKKQLTQSFKEAALEHSNPLSTTIEGLASEVSAIREYASLQQEKIGNFQERHDWKVIKTFCLRTIRVIDNIQKRIELLSQNNMETSTLEEISDELIFALESSSVEQFEPGINSEYRGQEKLAEAIKDRECSDKANMKGKIAKIVRTGYRYVMDDNDIKIIRPAQVKLYG